MSDEQQVFDGAGVSFQEVDALNELKFYLQYLSPNQRLVIVERFYYQHDVKSTAKRLGITQHAVKNRTRDAILKLREVLNNGGLGL